LCAAFVKNILVEYTNIQEGRHGIRHRMMEEKKERNEGKNGSKPAV
jgi:hypothetical protein